MHRRRQHPCLSLPSHPHLPSSADIWHSVCIAIRTALQKATSTHPPFTAASVRGIAFDATCSLVALGEDDVALSVSPDGEAEQNVIVWMDHRADGEAREINSSGHEVLRYVGGRMSVEMELPKLLWLKRHLPDTYSKAARFMDLADFLSYKATGRDGQQQRHSHAQQLQAMNRVQLPSLRSVVDSR
jgi:D-ribulokinase